MTVLAFSCPHAPYHHVDALDFLADLKRTNKPSEVVCLGDEADLYRFSSHDQEPDAYDIVKELRLARRFVKDLGKMFPALKVCTSNHVRRMTKKAAGAGLPKQVLKSWRDVIEAPPRWQWQREWILHGVHYFHADGYSGDRAIPDAITDHRANVVFGHLHTLGRVEYHQRRHWMNWGVSAGCLITAKESSPAIRYGKYHRKKPVRGAVVIADGLPIFEPLKV